MENENSSTGIRTQVIGFKVRGANHYTMELVQADMHTLPFELG